PRDRLIQADGSPVFGVFPDGVQHINYLDYDLRTPMDRKRGSLAKRFGFNQFQFISVLSDDLIIGVAIVDLKLVSNAFVYLYEPETKRYEEYSFLQPLGRSTQMDNRPNDGVCEFRKVRNRSWIIARTTPGARRLRGVIPYRL